MANNPYKNKVIYGNQTLIDLSSDTVTASSLLSGETAHDASGAPITGTVVIQHYYTGSSAPSASLGQNGDVYLQTS